MDSFRPHLHHDLKYMFKIGAFPAFLHNSFHKHLLASLVLLHRFLMLLIRRDLAEFNNHVAFNKTLFLPLLRRSLKAPLVPAPIICNPHVTSCLTLAICNVILWRLRQPMSFDLLFFSRDPSLCVLNRLGLKLIIECNHRHRLELYSYTSTEGPRH